LFTLLSTLTLGASVASADKSFSVDLADFSFSQKAFTVNAGEKVSFSAKNVGQRPHTIHIEGNGVNWTLNNGNIAPGASGSGDVTFTAPGTYEFFCPVGNHRQQGMVATFTVLAAGQQSSTLPRSGDAMGMIGLGFAGLGALSFGAGALLRRRGE
jgi:uncharacterized cupredoxin-like copper-binding protein